MRQARVALLLLVISAGALALAGCRVGGGASVERVNEELRREREALRSENATLRGEVAELRAKVAEDARERAARADANTAAAPDWPENRGADDTGDTAIAAARLVSIEIDRLSGWAPGDPASPVRAWAVYVRTIDGRGRAVQASGTLTVEVRDDAGVLLARRVLGPSALRDAYRSSFAGTHYAVEGLVEGAANASATSHVSGADADALGLALARAAARRASLAFRATLADGVTGLTHEAELQK